jgi:hypothetical protein
VFTGKTPQYRDRPDRRLPVAMDGEACMSPTDGMPVSCIMAESRRVNPHAMTVEGLGSQSETASQGSVPNPAGDQIRVNTLADPQGGE